MAAEQPKDAGSQPWHAKYPAPQHQPGSVTREAVLDMLQSDSLVAGRDYLLVDVRRNDHEGGTIRGSVNFPAQSLYASRSTIWQLAKAAGVKKVIFYCGSCNGRGPRAAGWFGDYLRGHDDKSMESLILEGGIKGWVAAGGDYTEFMDEYNPSAWSIDGQ